MFVIIWLLDCDTPPHYCLFCAGLCTIFDVLCVCDRFGAVLCVYACYEAAFSICVDYAAAECDWEVVGCLEYLYASFIIVYVEFVYM